MRNGWRVTGLLLCVLFAGSAFAATKPNVLLIVLDDAGYSDVAGFGRNDAPTPNLLQIANEGVRFTRHYADSTCKPSRLALLTGRVSAQVAQAPDFRGISPQVLTLAEVLQQNGYSTHHIGKWHLGDSVRDSWPDKQGFDDWFGFLNQFQLKGPDADGRFTKRPTYTNPFLQSDRTPLQQYQGHLEDILADRVVETIRQQKSSTPWFINYWLFAPHHPSVASAEFLQKFPPTPAGKYQALLAQADFEIGRAISALRETKQLDNTLVVVVSDNGGTNELMNNNAPFAGVKGGYQEGSLRTPLIVRWPDKRHAGEARDAIVAIQDIYPTVLGAAGIQPPANLDGQDLQPLLDGKTLLPRLLVHEMVNPGAFHFGVLSTDGNWRLADNALYDLVHDAASAQDVASQHPQQLKRMQDMFNTWREKKIALTLDYRQQNKHGVAIVSGDDFRRAPGYGAFSFAVDATWPARPPAQPMYIAEQPGVWSLRLNPDRTFTLQMGEDSMQTQALPDAIWRAGRANLLLSSVFTRSRLHEGRNHGEMQFHADSTLLMEWQQTNPQENTSRLSAPTFIGQRSDGSARWQGELGVAQFYNAALTAERTSMIPGDLSATEESAE